MAQSFNYSVNCHRHLLPVINHILLSHLGRLLFTIQPLEFHPTAYIHRKSISSIAAHLDSYNFALFQRIQIDSLAKAFPHCWKNGNRSAAASKIALFMRCFSQLTIGSNTKQNMRNRLPKNQSVHSPVAQSLPTTTTRRHVLPLLSSACVRLG